MFRYANEELMQGAKWDEVLARCETGKQSGAILSWAGGVEVVDLSDLSGEEKKKKGGGEMRLFG